MDTKNRGTVSIDVGQDGTLHIAIDGEVTVSDLATAAFYLTHTASQIASASALAAHDKGLKVARTLPSDLPTPIRQ